LAFTETENCLTPFDKRQIVTNVSTRLKRDAGKIQETFNTVENVLESAKFRLRCQKTKKWFWTKLSLKWITRKLYRTKDYVCT